MQNRVDAKASTMTKTLKKKKKDWKKVLQIS